MDSIVQLQQQLIEAIPALNRPQNPHDISEIISDEALLLRFLQKYRQNLEDTLQGIIYHLNWRQENNIIDITPFTNHYWLEIGLFRLGKIDSVPTIFIFPSKYDPNIHNATEQLTSSLILVLETLRRWIISYKNVGLKVIAILDLHKFGLSQMDFELIPIVYDIFKRHYPQLLSKCLVLNYGWIHAGLWSVIRTLLTDEARKKLMFIKSKQLQDYVPIEDLPTIFGGKQEFVNYLDCNVLNTFGYSDIDQLESNENYNGVYTKVKEMLPQEEFYDCESIASIPKSVRSAADLQQLFPSSHPRFSDKFLSNSNLHALSNTNLSRKSFSNLNLSRRSKSNLSLKHHSRSSLVLRVPSTTNLDSKKPRSNLYRLLKSILRIKIIRRTTKISLLLLMLFVIKLAFRRKLLH